MSKKQEQMSASDFNLIKVSTKELEDTLAASIQYGSNVAIFGRRGSGKTEIAKQQIKKSGCLEVYLNLSVLERVDLGGYVKIFENTSDYVQFFLPSFFKPIMEGNQKVVALLDEVDKTDPSMWAPLLELTQFRSINGRVLKNLHAVIMTGNLISEGGNRPSLPLLDRAEKYLVEPSVKAWLNWSGSSGAIHPSIIAYITDHPQDLFGLVDPEDRYSDPSPRSWKMASDLLKAGESYKWDVNVITNKVASCVGKTIGIKYSNYYEHYHQLLPLVSDIFEGKDISAQYKSLEPTKKLIIALIAGARLKEKLDSNSSKNPKELAYVGRFMSQASPETVLIAIRSQVTMLHLHNYKIDKHPEWVDMIDNIVKRANG